MPMRHLRAWLAALLLGLGSWAWALTPEQAFRMADGDGDDRIAALNEVATAGDVSLAAYLQALLADEVRVAGGKAYLVRGDVVVEAGSGAAAALPDGAEEVVNNNRMRGELEAALAALRLFSPDRSVRAQSIGELKDKADAGRLRLLEKALVAEPDAVLKGQLAALVAAARLSSPERAARLSAARLLASSADPATRSLLLQALAGETDTEVKAAMQASLQAIQGRLAWGERLGVHRSEPGFHPDAGRARPGHHLRPHGRHQHGAR
jgi:urea transport system permease protein